MTSSGSVTVTGLDGRPNLGGRPRPRFTSCIGAHSTAPRAVEFICIYPVIIDVYLLRNNDHYSYWVGLNSCARGYHPGAQKRLVRFLAAAFCLLAILLGAAQTWTHRDTISSVDAVSYLDVADAYRQGRWNEAVNGYWNPLYSWILAIVLRVAQPSPEKQYEVVKLVDYAIYLLCLFSFTWFLGQLRRAYHRCVDAEGHTMHIPDWVWVVAGYTLFIWSSLKWITLSSNTPDMAGAALCYAAWGLLIRARRRELPHRYRKDVLLVLRCSSSEPSSCCGAGAFGRRAWRICAELSPRLPSFSCSPHLISNGFLAPADI